MKLLLSLFIVIIAFSAKSFAEEINFGFVRVRATSVTVGHNKKVTMKVSGNTLTSFSHEMGGTFSKENSGGWIALRFQHLNPRGMSSSLTTAYDFEKSDCNFNYYIDFSFDKNNVVATFGPFDAPSVTANVSLPIGGGCEGGMRVCSSDSAMQNKLLKAYKKVLVDNYNIWKADYDNEMRARAEKNRADADALAAELVRQRQIDFESGAKVLQAHIDQWNKEFEIFKKESASQFDDLITPEETQIKAEGLAEKAAEMAKAQANAHDIAIANAQNGSLVMAIGYGMVQFDQGLTTLSQQNHEYNNYLRKNGEWTPADQRAEENFDQGVAFMHRQVIHGEKALDLVQFFVKEGVTVINPWAGFALSACEAYTGRPMCIFTEGNEKEHLKKICEFATEYRLPWDHLRGIIFDELGPVNELVLKAFENEVRSGACGAAVGLPYL